MKRENIFNYLTLIIMLIFFIVIIGVIYKNSRNYYYTDRTIIGVLQILVGIIIFMGFNLIISFNSAVTEWREIKKFIDPYNNILERLKEITPEEFDNLKEYIKNKSGRDIEYKLRLDNYQKTIKAISLSFLNFLEDNTQQKSSQISRSIDVLYVFLNKSIVLFEYPEGKYLNLILDSIEALYNYRTSAAMEILKMRLDISKSLIDYLSEHIHKVKYKIDEAKNTHEAKVEEDLKRELEKMEELRINEIEIYNKINCIFMYTNKKNLRG